MRIKVEESQTRFRFGARYAENFKRLREKNGMTQAEFAKEVYYSDKMIGAIERGSRYPSIELVYDVADKFNVGIDFLTGRTSSMRAEVQSITDVIGLSEKSVERLSEMKSNHYRDEKLLKVIDILIEQSQVLRLLHDYLFNEQWLDKPLTYDGGLQIINNEDIRQVIFFTLVKELSQIRERLIAEKKKGEHNGK